MNVTKKTGKMRLLGMLLVLCMVFTLLPATVFAEPLQTIEEVSISVKAPVAGQPCSVEDLTITTVPADAAYIDTAKTCTWRTSSGAVGSGDTFDAEKDYRLYVSNITPNPGFKFEYDYSTTGYPYLGKVYINGVEAHTAKANGNPMQVHSEYIEPTSGTTTTPEIDKVEISGFSVPVLGGYPDFDVTVTTPDCYLATVSQFSPSTSAPPLINGVAWYDDDDGTYLSETSVFRAGIPYHARIYIWIDEDASLDPSATASINGDDSLLDSFDKGTYPYVIKTRTFTFTDPTTTYDVDVITPANVTKTGLSGDENQTVAAGAAMTEIVYTANEGYYFPDSYGSSEEGIDITKISNTQIKISGIPTDNVTVVPEGPTEKSAQPAPAVVGDELKITGTTTEMEYAKEGDTSWTDCTATETTVASAGDYKVRLKETETKKAGEEATVTVTAPTAPTIAEIAAVNLTVTAPKTGATPSTATTADTAYSVASTDWEPVDDPFNASTVYKVAINLEAPGTEKFTENTKFYINGEEATLISPNPITGGVEEVRVSYTFPETEAAAHTHTGTLVPEKEPTFTADGNMAYYVCSCGKFFRDAECNDEILNHDDVILPMLKYEITKGMDGVYTKGSGKTLEFTANGPEADCTGVKVDGAVIDAANYTRESGSTIITLKNDYLETLSETEHSIIVLYGDREEATTTFTVKAAAETTPTTTYALTASVTGGHGAIEISGGKTEFAEGEDATIKFTPDSGYVIDKVTVNGVETRVIDNLLTVKMDGDKTIVVTYKQAQGSSTGEKTDPSKPAQTTTTSTKAGDDSNMLLWIALLFASCGGITTLFVNKKRIRSK